MCVCVCYNLLFLEVRLPCLSSWSFGLGWRSVGGIAGFNCSSLAGRLLVYPDFVAVLRHGTAVTQADGTHAAVFTFGLVVELIDAAADTIRTNREAQAAPNIKSLLIQVTLQLTDRAGQAAPGSQAADGIFEAGAEVVFVAVLFEEVEGRAGHVCCCLRVGVC